MKTYKFLIETAKGDRKYAYVNSKHLQGAVRQVYQMHEVEKIVRICDAYADFD